MVSARTLSLFSGSWSLLNITAYQNGAVLPLEGWNPTGIISYTPQGYMQMIIQTLGQLNGDDTTDDLASSLGNLTQLATMDYAGRYHFEAGGDTVAGTVVHGPIQFSSVPGWLGSVFLRNFTFADDGEYMSLAGPVSDELSASLWWQKSTTTENWTWEKQS